MTLNVSAGKLIITKPGGATVFDTDDKLFHVTNTVNGSIAIPNLTGQSGVTLNTTTTWNLGAVHASATQVIGAVKFTLNTYESGVPFDRWTTFMGGTVVWLQDGYDGINGSNNMGSREFCAYHFDISGGQCRLVRRWCIPGYAGADSYTILAHTIEYKLKCGVWV